MVSWFWQFEFPQRRTALEFDKLNRSAFRLAPGQLLANFSGAEGSRQGPESAARCAACSKAQRFKNPP